MQIKPLRSNQIMDRAQMIRCTEHRRRRGLRSDKLDLYSMDIM